MKEKKEKKLQYSKLLPIVTCIIFVFCLYKGFTADFSTVLDASFFVTAITLSGGIFGSAIVWYMKKSQSENTVKLKTELYKVASQERLHYNEQMIILKNKYMLSDEEMMEIENDSPMDDFETNALSDIEATINDAQSEADASVELQTY